MTANIFIYDEIGEQTSLKSVRSQYAMFKNPKDVVVHINSIGGDVAEGYAIHDYLKSLNKPITTKIDGKCYSIATVIALAGDERLMSENAEIMIHNPWMNAGYGDANHYKNVSAQLEKEEKKLAEFYVQKTKVGIAEVQPMMDKETYLKFDEALKYGFITGESTQLKAVAKLNMQTEEKDKFQTFFDKIEALFTSKKAMEHEDEEKKAMEMTLEDGTPIFIDSEDGDFVGKAVFVVGEEGQSPAPNGTHVLDDGRSIVVADGIITEVMEAAGMDDEMAKMKEELEALRAENASLKASKEEEMQAKEEAIVAMKKESDDKFASLEKVIKEMKAMVMTEDAPKPVNKKPVVEQKKKTSPFDSLIAK